MANMRNSVENRSPLLDYEVVEVFDVGSGSNEERRRPEVAVSIHAGQVFTYLYN